MPVNAARRAGARIAVAGATGRSAAARALLRAELDGVAFIDAERAESGGLHDALRDADMLVFVAGSGETADERSTAALADAARERGVLVAAVIVGSDAPGRSQLLGALRDAADMVMIVRDPDDVRAVVSALR